MLHARATVRRLAALACFAALACRPARSTAPPRDDPPAPARGPSALQRDFGLPLADGERTPKVYVQLRDALQRIDREHPELLPTLRGDDRRVLERASDVDRLTELARAVTVDERLELIAAVGDLHRLYMARIYAGEPYGDEAIAFAVAAFALDALHMALTLSGSPADEQALRNESSRLKGFVGVRYGLARGIRDLLVTARALPRLVDPGRSVEAVARVAPDVAPWLLPEDRDELHAVLDDLARLGASATYVDALRTAVAPDREAHPLVEAFAREHREYADRTAEINAKAVAGALAPIEVGREPGGVRYAFPNAGFSAVFPRRPSAQLQHVDADGAPVTGRFLGSKDPGGVTRSVQCLVLPYLRPPALDEVLNEAVVRMKLTDVHPATVARGQAIEGLVVRGDTHQRVRVIAITSATTCIVTVEVPRRLADAIEADARRFIDSVDLGGFAR